MAAASGPAAENWQKKVLCRFFVNGLCRAGENCIYGHDRSLSNRGTLPCKYFATGTCAYGDKCRFSHGDPAPIQDEVSFLSDEMQAVSINTPYVDTSWAEAPEFVPGAMKAPAHDSAPPDSDLAVGDKSKTWAEIVNPVAMAELTVSDAESQLCPFYMCGECRYGENCAYVHGFVCDMCGQPILHPSHEAQRKSHTKLCMERHEEDMNHAFAVAKSKDKTCGICMEVVIDKPKGEARFGIMPNCNHCYCLSCLRKWRQAKQFEHKIVRACPECRQTSDYICPSLYWVDTKEEKDRLLADYKANLLTKECKYFSKGEGTCPFGNKCFYRHASADGKVIDVGPPPQNQVRRNSHGDAFVERLLLYDFLEERDGQFVLPLEILDVLDVLDVMSDSEDSDEYS